MRYKADLESYITNMKFYAEQIKITVDKQFDEDFKNKEVNIDEADKRFRALGGIDTDAEWIELYLRSIIFNIQEVVKTDKTFNKIEEEQQEIGTTESTTEPTESTRSMFGEQE